MAGTLTHFLVMKKYFERQKIEVPFGTEDPYLSSAFLGATGPDIFYIASDQDYISDFHHYKNAGVFIKNLYNLWQRKRKDIQT